MKRAHHTFQGAQQTRVVCVVANATPQLESHHTFQGVQQTRVVCVVANATPQHV
jgi:hypothetical protein